MMKKILYTFGFISISIIGFFTGFIIIEKLHDINNNSLKAQVIDTIIENEEIVETNEIKNVDLIEDTEMVNIVPENIEQEIKIEDTEVKEVKKEKSKTPPCPTPAKEYDDMWLYPIGQNTGLLDTTYIPKDLTEVDILYSTKKGICLVKDAHDNFEAMIKKAQEDGYLIKVSSGFRNYSTQKSILSNAIKNGNKNADIAIAKAGYSEHQLGVAIDITGQSIEYDSASNKFQKSKEAQWIEENASDYGFIESYGKGKEDITGYMYEPWHYRYVGIDNAKEIIKNNQTINEYLESIK